MASKKVEVKPAAAPIRTAENLTGAELSNMICNTLSKEQQKEAAMIRYEQYCKSFISLAEQATMLEKSNELGINFNEARTSMWYLLQEMLHNKPKWA